MNSSLVYLVQTDTIVVGFSSSSDESPLYKIKTTFKENFKVQLILFSTLK